MMRRKTVLAITLCVALGTMLGCGSSYEVVPVKGTVTYEGQPVTELTVQFKPEEGRASTGSVGTDGAFEMTYTMDQMGVEPGKHTVTIMHEPATDEGGPLPELTKKALDDFKANGPIEVTIEEPQDNFEIKLPR